MSKTTTYEMRNQLNSGDTRLDRIEKLLNSIEARMAILEAQKPQGTFTGNFPTGFGTREGYHTVPSPEYRSPEWYAEYQDRLERKRAQRSWW